MLYFVHSNTLVSSNNVSFLDCRVSDCVYSIVNTIFKDLLHAFFVILLPGIFLF